MGFFDSILTEEETSVAVKTVEKEDSKENIESNISEDLVILSDSENVTISDLTSEINDEPVILDDIKIEESEDKIEETEEKEVILESEDKTEEKIEDFLVPEIKNTIEENNDSSGETSSTVNFGFDSSYSDLGSTKGDSSSTGSDDDFKKQDPNNILDEAVIKLQELLRTHSSLRESKMSQIEEINKKIASLKDEAKVLTNEAKNISEEESKVSKMIEVFNNQKI